MAMATSPLEDKFGVSSHNIVVKSQDGDSSTNQHTQQLILSDIHWVEEGHQQAKSVDFMDICTLPKLKKSTTSLECSEWWADLENNLWTDWDIMEKKQVVAWQYCINKRFGIEDMTASRWLKEFIYASSTDSLRNAVAKKYNKLDKHTRGGVMYLFLTLCEMFQMSKEVKLAMLSFIDFFKKGGITKYSGENILIASE
jgi:hypothetical protein